jgi:hypothetical protein
VREYYLREAIFHSVSEELDFRPDVDAFASTPYLPSEINLQHPSEAMKISWAEKRLFLHPPIHWLARTIKKLMKEGAQAMLVAPNWKGQPWSPMLAELAQRSRILGSFEQVMETTARFRSEGWCLPPGDVQVVTLDTRTMKGTNS